LTRTLVCPRAIPIALHLLPGELAAAAATRGRHAEYPSPAAWLGSKSVLPAGKHFTLAAMTSDALARARMFAKQPETVCDPSMMRSAIPELARSANTKKISSDRAPHFRDSVNALPPGVFPGEQLPSLAFTPSAAVSIPRARHISLYLPLRWIQSRLARAAGSLKLLLG